MFGNVPRALWSRWIPPDEQHRIPLACRCLLVCDGERRILFETGIGAFFAPALRERYGVVEDRHVLVDSLASHGLTPGDIDVVVLSHLHFDHAGGVLGAWREGTDHELIFARATFVVSAEAWMRAKSPHPRDRASFIPELVDLLERSGRLDVVIGTSSDSLGPGYRFHYSHGHTPGLLMTEIAMARGPVVFVADLIPGRPWVHLPVTMGYDRAPERLIDEKQALLEDLIERGGRLFYTHDHQVAMSGIARDEKGRFHAIDPVDHLDHAAE